MKTLVDVKTQYMELFDQAKKMSVEYDGRRAFNNVKKRLQFLRNAIFYLESCPQAEYITGSLRGLKDRYNRLREECPFLDAKNPELKKLLKEWQKENGYNKIKNQIKFLSYILN